MHRRQTAGVSAVTVRPSPGEKPARSRPVGEVLLLLAALVPFALLVHRFWFVIDDAFISFRYAQNLAHGHGLRYNLNENPPVEGYSNFLWTLLCAAYEMLGLELTLFAPLTGTVCGVLLILLVGRALRQTGVTGLPRALALFGMACFPPLALWSSTGLETMAFALLVFWMFERLVLRPAGPDAVRGAVAGVLVSLIRVEGLAWALIILLLAAVSAALAGRMRSARRPLACVAGVVLALYAAYFGWRWMYFDTLIANTALAKGDLQVRRLERGVDYVVSFALTFLTPLLILPASFVALAPRRVSTGLAVAAMAWAFPAYAVAVTGDFMPMGRFLVPGVAFQTLLVGWLWSDLAGRRGGARVAACGAAGIAALALGALPAWNVHLVPRALLESLRFRFNTPSFMTEYEQWQDQKSNAAYWSAAGRALRAYVDARRPGELYPSVVLGAIGAVGYYSGLHVWDRHGLVTPRVARRSVQPDEPLLSAGHDKRVPPEFFLDERPTILNYRLLQNVPRRAAAAAARRMAATLRADMQRVPGLAAYVVDVFEIGPGGAGTSRDFLLTTVRIPDGMPPDEAWDAFQNRVRALASEPAPAPGGLHPPGDPVPDRS